MPKNPSLIRCLFPTVVVVSSPFTDKLEIEKLSTPVEDLIVQQSPTFIRNYGLDQLQTIQFRGLPAGHSAIYWNGLPVNNPYLNQIDLVNIPIIGQQVDFSSNGDLITMQNGAAINVVSAVEELDTNLVGVTVGAFNRYRINALQQFTAGRSKHEIGVQLRRASNNYAYTFNNERRSLQDANLRQLFVTTSSFWPVGQNEWKLSTQYNRLRRNIPPVLGVDDGVAVEFDENLWLNMSYHSRIRNWDIDAQIGALIDRIDYDDENIDLFARSISYRLPLTFMARRTMRAITMKWYSSLTFLRLVTNNFNENVDDVQRNAQIEADYTGHALSAGVTLKYEGSKVSGNFLSSALRFRFIPSSHFLLEGTVSRIYTLPGYNDLFWAEGGNAAIRPERSWKLLLAAKYTAEKISISLTPYFYSVNDWILWLPGRPFWSPVNIQNVHSYGLDLSASVPISNRIHLKSLYGYNRVVNKSTAFPGDQSEDKQLIYSPLHRLSLIASIKWDKLQIAIQGTAFSRLYTSRDNLQFLPGQFIPSLSVDYTIKDRLRCSATINNLLSTEYQVIRGRAQPPRFLETTITYSF